MTVAISRLVRVTVWRGGVARSAWLDVKCGACRYQAATSLNSTNMERWHRSMADAGEMARKHATVCPSVRVAPSALPVVEKVLANRMAPVVQAPSMAEVINQVSSHFVVHADGSVTPTEAAQRILDRSSLTSLARRALGLHRTEKGPTA